MSACRGVGRSDFVAEDEVKVALAQVFLEQGEIAAGLELGLGDEAVFAVAAVLVLDERNVLVVLLQDVLREVIKARGVIGMAENIAKKPDIIKTDGHLFRGFDEIMQRITVFMKVRQDQVTSVQRDRLSSAMEKASPKRSFSISESSSSFISFRIPDTIIRTAFSLFSSVKG